MKTKSKRYKELIKNASKEKKLSAKDILELVKKNANAKFEESIDVTLRINLKQSKGGDFSLRTTVKLPNGSGKKEIVAALCEPDKQDLAKKAGADLVGSDDLIEKIAKGKFNFTKLVCTPSMMSKIGKYGKILGPKGLMPNPKLGTVSDDIVSTVDKVKNKFSEIKNDKDGNVGISIGRKSFPEKKLMENFKTLFETLKKEKPNMFNSEIIKNIYVSPTIGPSLKISFKDI